MLFSGFSFFFLSSSDNLSQIPKRRSSIPCFICFLFLPSLQGAHFLNFELICICKKKGRFIYKYIRLALLYARDQMEQNNTQLFSVYQASMTPWVFEEVKFKYVKLKLHNFEIYEESRHTKMCFS